MTEELSFGQFKKHLTNGKKLGNIPKFKLIARYNQKLKDGVFDEVDEELLEEYYEKVLAHWENAYEENRQKASEAVGKLQQEKDEEDYFSYGFPIQVVGFLLFTVGTLINFF